MKSEDLSLYLVTDRELSLGRSLEFVVEEAVKGGVTMVQLREKDSDSFQFYKLGLKLKALLKTYNVPLIINDRLDIALAVDADGIHLGQSDLPWQEARKILGDDKIIGLSVESFEQAESANEAEVDYIGISPVFSTPTKTDTVIEFGLEGVTKVRNLCKHPAVAIGGIHPHNAKEIINAGADGIAVVSAICSAESPQKAAQELKQIIS